MPTPATQNNPVANTILTARANAAARDAARKEFADKAKAKALKESDHPYWKGSK